MHACLRARARVCSLQWKIYLRRMLAPIRCFITGIITVIFFVSDDKMLPVRHEMILVLFFMFVSHATVLPVVRNDPVSVSAFVFVPHATVLPVVGNDPIPVSAFVFVSHATVLPVVGNDPKCRGRGGQSCQGVDGRAIFPPRI